MFYCHHVFIIFKILFYFIFFVRFTSRRHAFHIVSCTSRIALVRLLPLITMVPLIKMKKENCTKHIRTLTSEPSYIIEGHVCYLTTCDRAYPKKLAFQYLEDIKNEFERAYGNQIETAARPYAFIKFGKFLSLPSYASNVFVIFAMFYGHWYGSSCIC